MVVYALYMAAALYLGLLTSISPCPLTTNIAAISYVGRHVGTPTSVITAGVLYTLGRCLVYLALAFFLATTAASIPTISLFLQKYMHLVLAPVFLLLGMYLVGLISIMGGGVKISEPMQKRVNAMGTWGALLLGGLFALSFCPTSAAWFFGLVALMMGVEAGAIATVLTRIGIVLPDASLPGGFLILPIIYGLGTGVPVIFVAFLLAYSAQSVAKTYQVLAQIECWARQFTGWLFIVIGAHFALKYGFEADLAAPLLSLLRS